MKGCALYDIFYPKPIHVDKGESHFMLDGECFYVGISSHQEAVNTMSFPNTIQKGSTKYEFRNPVETFANQTCYWNPTTTTQPSSIFLMTTQAGNTNFNYTDSLTTVRVAFEANSLDSDTIEKAVKALNHFIQVYRYVSKDMDVRETSFISGLHPYLVGSYKTYSPAELQKTSAKQRIAEIFDDGWASTPTQFHSLQKPINNTFDAKIITGGIAHYLVNDSFFTWMQTMNRSYELSLVQQHHNSAIIEAFLSVELRLFEFVSYKNIRVRFNRRRQDSPTIFDVIKAMKTTLGDEMCTELHSFRRLRNDIVHSGYKSNHEECLKSLDTATKIHSKIDSMMPNSTP